MRRAAAGAGCLCILVLGLGACAGPAPPGPGLSAPRLATLPELTDGLLAEHRERVLVVNFWATWCAPCVAELPELVKFHEEFGPRGVDMVGISLDFLDLDRKGAVPEALTRFLERRPLPYGVLVKDTTETEALINFYDEAWGGAIPATFIYDKTGRQVFAREGEIDYLTLKKEVEPLLP